jgi:hypothetical protein
LSASFHPAMRTAHLLRSPNDTQPQRLCLGARISGISSCAIPTRGQHLYTVGQTSTLLFNHIAQDIAAGEGFAFLDPHGDLAK